jgi:xylan 1,4-beta-xylosidase
MGTLWSFYDPSPNEQLRLTRKDRMLVMKGKGKTPSDCSPLTCIAGDQAYRITVDIETSDLAEGGMLLYYSRRLYAGLGFGPQGLVMHRYGLQRPRGAIPGQRDPGGGPVRKLAIRLTNQNNILTIHTSADDRKTWRKFDVQMEVSGYHHNVAYDFLSLRPALYAAGEGDVRFRNFTYEAL